MYASTVHIRNTPPLSSHISSLNALFRIFSLRQEYLSLESDLLDQVYGRVKKTSEDLIKAESAEQFDY